MAKRGNRIQVIMECTEHKNSGMPGTSRYITTKNKKNTTERLELKKYNPILLSSPSASESSRLGKRLWVKKYLPGTKLILASAEKKQNYSGKDKILIDDRPDNIEQWRARGGKGILHVNAQDTINQLQNLGL